MMNLPPGLRGYVAADQLRSQKQAQQLGMLSQLAAMQNAQAQQEREAQLFPLKLSNMQLEQRKVQDALSAAEQQRNALTTFAQSLPEADRALFLANPTEFIKERNKKHTVGRYLVTGTGDTVFAAPKDPTLTEVGVAGQPGVTQRVWAQPGSSEVTPVGDPKMPEILNPAVQRAKQNVAAAGATKVTVPVSVSTERKYGEQFAGKMADQDAAMLEAARKAPEMAERALRVRQLLQNPTITGTGAEFRLQLGKVAQLAGLNFAQDAVTNTELLVTELAKNTLDAIKASGLGSGTGFSNADRDFLEKAVGGKISLEKETIARLATLNHRAAVKSAEKWNTRVREIPPSALEGTGVKPDPVNVPAAAGKTVVRRGTFNGRRVVEYSDGTTEYER